MSSNQSSQEIAAPSFIQLGLDILKRIAGAQVQWLTTQQMAQLCALDVKFVDTAMRALDGIVTVQSPDNTGRYVVFSNFMLNTWFLSMFPFSTACPYPQPVPYVPFQGAWGSGGPSTQGCATGTSGGHTTQQPPYGLRPFFCPQQPHYPAWNPAFQELKVPGQFCQELKVPGQFCQELKVPGQFCQELKVPGQFCQELKVPGQFCQEPPHQHQPQISTTLLAAMHGASFGCAPYGSHDLFNCTSNGVIAPSAAPCGSVGVKDNVSSADRLSAVTNGGLGSGNPSLTEMPVPLGTTGSLNRVPAADSSNGAGLPLPCADPNDAVDAKLSKGDQPGLIPAALAGNVECEADNTERRAPIEDQGQPEPVGQDLKDPSPDVNEGQTSRSTPLDAANSTTEHLRQKTALDAPVPGALARESAPLKQQDDPQGPPESQAAGERTRAMVVAPSGTVAPHFPAQWDPKLGIHVT